MNAISETDLILNADGSIYHLNLLPEDVADTIITVGDQERVHEITKYFDHIELKKGKREFITHTGRLGQKRITVISTGIGTDNIDIVLNELDALVNIDFTTRIPYSVPKSLNIIRIGTSGSLQDFVPIDSLLVSSAAFGLDALMHYYEQRLNDEDHALLNAFRSIMPNKPGITPYLATAGSQLLQQLASEAAIGITITAPGFYAPQGRQVRTQNTLPNLMQLLQRFNYNGQQITNLEMETAGIYGLASNLGHQAISFNVILANRITNTFSRQPLEIMDTYIKQILEKIEQL